MNMMNVENSNIAYELQKRLIQCCIDFIQETGNEDIDEVLFNVDCLQVSVNAGKWHPGTDSACTVNGWNENEGTYEISHSV